MKVTEREELMLGSKKFTIVRRASTSGYMYDACNWRALTSEASQDCNVFATQTSHPKLHQNQLTEYINNYFTT